MIQGKSNGERKRIEKILVMKMGWDDKSARTILEVKGIPWKKLFTNQKINDKEIWWKSIKKLL